MPDTVITPRQLRRTVLIVAALNFAYFFVEVGVALALGLIPVTLLELEKLVRRALGRGQRFATTRP